MEPAQGKMQVVRLVNLEDVLGLIKMFEGIASELSWQPGTQLRTYAPAAAHFGAYVDGVLAGGMQLVPAAGDMMLPCEHVWPEVRLPRRATTAHVAILAVRPEYRGKGGLLWPICIAMWRYCAASGIADISLEVTPQTYRLYRRLGWPLDIIGELRTHWGEDCYLCRMSTVEVAGSMAMKAYRSASYRDILSRMVLPLETHGMLPQSVRSETLLTNAAS